MKQLLNFRKKEGQKTKKKFIATLTLAMVMALSFCSTVFATTPAPIDLAPIQTAITGSISVAQIVSVIAAVIAGSMAFVLIWFGARKLTKSILSAFKSGKLHF